MKGTNPIRQPMQDDGRTLALKEIFPTLQGEGPRAGQPAMFIRLGGCNLACDFCDTQFEDFMHARIEDIVAKVPSGLTVITGGEPLRQNIAPLCEALIAKGCTVQIETNGTLYRELPETVEIVCSPKNAGGGYYPLRPDLLARVTAFKFLVSASHPGYSEVPDVGQGTIPVYVQPMDEADAQKNAANLARATQFALTRGYRLSLQLHKIAGIP